jgi:hypothetical protein
MLYDSAFYGPTFTIDTLTINGSTDANGCDWILTSEKGWNGKPAPKTNRYDKPASRGTFIGSEHPGSRVVTLDFRLSAPDVPTLRNAQDQVLGICADASTLYPLTCTDERGLTLSAQAKLDGEVLLTPVSATSVDVSIQLVCPDPRKTSTLPHIVTAGLVAAGVGGVAYPVAYPVNYGTPGASGSLVLPNAGNAPADMTLAIVGTATQPTLTNPATNDVVSYMGGLSPTDQLVLNTSSGRVLLNSIDRRSLLSVIRWPRIPANNTLRLVFTSNNNADSGTVVATYYDTYY